jgi:hypothetical protein
VPKPNDAPLMTGILGGFPGLDAKGRIVYRGNPSPAPRPACNADGTRPLPKPPDHGVIVRIDPATRMIDTFATLKTPTQLIKVNAAPLMISLAQSPMPVADDWAILPNGTVAVVRVVDYHVDWFGADGAGRPTGKVPFDWVRMTDSSKAAFVDSAQAALAKRFAPRAVEIINESASLETFTLPASVAGCSGPPPGADGGEGRGRAEVAVGGAVRAAAPAGANAPPASAAGSQPPLPAVLLGGAAFLPDYAPPFSPGSVRADVDGNIWVRTSITMGGGSVYDVINDKGDLVDRLIAPPGRVIAGFGPGGVVYMGVKDGNVTKLERARRSATTP